MEPLRRLGVVLRFLLPMLYTSGSSTAELTQQRTSHVSGTPPLDPTVRDCGDLPSGTSSGVYMIMVDLQTPAPVLCDMDDGEGWTVFQRRADITPRQDFYQDWQAYKWGLGGFGGEFWWGLHYLWQLTSQPERQYELRVDLWDWEGETRYATYQNFTIASEADGYRIDFVGYAGNAGDSLAYHNGMMFSTFDKDQDAMFDNCAEENQGAWWYNACYRSNLNGQYLPGSSEDTGIMWADWRDYYSLNATTMKLRRTKKL